MSPNKLHITIILFFFVIVFMFNTNISIFLCNIVLDVYNFSWQHET